MKKVSLAGQVEPSLTVLLLPRDSASSLKPWVYVVALGLLALVTLTAWPKFRKYSTSSRRTEEVRASPMPSLAGEKSKSRLSEQGIQRSLNEAIQAARYGVNWVNNAPIPNESGAFQAHNPGQGYSTYFAENEVHLVHRTNDEKWRVALKLTGISYGQLRQPLSTSKWSPAETRISASHQIEPAIDKWQSTVTEWYENNPEGLEQGFTINSPPDSNLRTPESQLRLTLELKGDLQPRLDSDQQAVSFVKEMYGAARLRYGQLKATDANGKELVSRMELQGDELSLVVDDHDAVYPLTIDPLFTQTKKLRAPDPTQSAGFGSGVAIDGDTVVVGASSGLNTQQGSAYIFERNVGGADNWALVKELTAADGVLGDGFGSSVAISHDTVFISAPIKKVGFNVGQGSVYVYERNNGGANNWGLVKQLTSSDGEQKDSFGWSVDVDGDNAIIGMTTHPTNNTITTSAAYIFERNAGGANNWGQTKLITRTDNQDDWGGYSVAISGDTAIIGAPKHVNFATSTIGGAYVIQRNEGGTNNWGIVKKLNSGLLFVNNTFFGVAVSIDGDRLVVGAGNENIPGETTENAAYVFDRNRDGSNNWGLVKKIVASDDVSGNAFALSLSISGDTLVAGARGAPIGADTQRGAAYVYKQNTGGADNWGLDKKVIAADGTSNDLFGWSVSLDGKSLIIGAPLDDGASPRQGSAYLFKSENDSWIEDPKTVPSGCTVNDNFGFSVAISGDTAVIGTNASDVGSKARQGAAYVFERNQGGPNNWGLIKSLKSTDGAADDHFGISVSISGNSIIVGAYRHAVGSNSLQGAAYIFERNQGGANNWGEVKQLIASDGKMSDSFGLSVAVSADTAVVGSYFHKVGSNALQGAAYLFERNAGGSNNWGESKILIASDGTIGDEFGWSVAISDNTVVVGAINDKVGGNVQQGSAYIFERNGGGVNNWGETKHVTASDGAAEDIFGGRVAISGNTVIVGSSQDDVGGNEQQGSAYVYERDQGGVNNWGESKHLISPNGAAADYFGGALGISGDSIVVGSVFHSVGGNVRQGSSYVFGRNTGGTSNWGLVQELSASDGSAHDRFGVPAIDGNTVVVGAFGDDLNGIFNLGSGYIFVKQATLWTQQAHLLPPLPTNCEMLDAYGSAVAIDGDTVVIGAPSDAVGVNFNQGSAYVLDRNEGGPNHWGVVKLLLASDGTSHVTNDLTYGDRFGSSVGVDGNTIVVGAPQATIGTNIIEGAAYVFERNADGPNNWGEVKKLTASDGQESLNFGSAASIDHNTIVIGAPLDDVNGMESRGSAYIFERDIGGEGNWGELKKLTASDGAALDYFAGSVSIGADTVIIGAYFHDGPNSNQGAAYIFERNSGGQNSWGEVKKLFASDGQANDFFGLSVDISNNTAIVGSAFKDVGAKVDQGAAYVFARNSGGANNWGELKRLVATDGEAGDFFGYGVGISGDTAIVGAPLDDVGQKADQGSAYIFEQNKNGPDQWGQVQRLEAGAGSTGDGFGRALAISGNDIIIGANIAQVSPPTGNSALTVSTSVGNTQGSAFVFRGVASTSTPFNVPVVGHIATANNTPVAGVEVRLSGTQNRLTVTDALGNYRFDNVATSGSYTVTPSHVNFTFSPQQRSLSQLTEQTDASFTATANSAVLNPIDSTAFFVRQHYIDFLNREPDEPGLNFWINNIDQCGANQNCREVQRINTSAAFFLSIEFQQTGYLIYRTYAASYGNMPNAPVPLTLSEFLPDTQQIGANVIVNQTGWEQQLENNKQSFITAFIQRSRFSSAFPSNLTPAQFVDKLFLNAGVTPSPSERTAAINEFGSAGTSSDITARARALRRVAENTALQQQEFEPAFVLMQYFGYLRRDPNTGADTDFSGYNFWLTKLRSFNGNFQNAEMVKAFLSSTEYRQRFGP